MEIVDILNKVLSKYKEFKNQEVQSVLDLGSYYVVALTYKNLKPDEFVLDNEWKIDKKTFKMTSFRLDMDRQKYLKSLKNPLYVRGGNNND